MILMTSIARFWAEWGLSRPAGVENFRLFPHSKLFLNFYSGSKGVVVTAGELATGPLVCLFEFSLHGPVRRSLCR